MLLLLNITYNVIVPVLLVIGLGILLERLFSLSPKALSSVAFYVLVPSLVINGLAHSNLEINEIGLILVLEIVLSLVLALVGWILARIVRLDQKLESAFMLTIAFINAGNYGLAVNELAFGVEGLQRAIIFFIGTGVTGSTLGVFLASRGTASISRSLLNILLVPAPYATIVGLTINLGYVALPLPVDRAITLLSNAAVPVMLITLGVQLSRTSLKGKFKPILLATTTRLVISPILALPLAVLMGLTGLTQQVILTQSGMPTAVTSTILATEFRGDAGFTSAVVLISTLASVVTLSILLTIIM